MSVLATPVLKLNKNYEAICTYSVEDAISDLFTGVVEAVYIDENGVYGSYNFNSWASLSALKREYEDRHDWLNQSIIVPRIVRCMKYYKRHYKGAICNRNNILERDKYVCQYCNTRFDKKMLEIEHVIPHSRGGKNTWENLVTACRDCNQKKRDRTPAEADMRLIKVPEKYTRPTGFRLPYGMKVYENWDQFISDAYWNVELKE